MLALDFGEFLTSLTIEVQRDLAYLLQICFDNSRHLTHKSYLFEYKGTQFKLFQNDQGNGPIFCLRLSHITTVQPVLRFFRGQQNSSALSLGRRAQVLQFGKLAR
jgi:hypothetical protein